MSSAGQIIKGIGGFYYVKTKDGRVYECRAKGRFRKENQTLLTGDEVTFNMPTDTESGVITDVHERKNELVRPPVANIDLLLIVVSANKPVADLLMVDRLLVYCDSSGIDAALIINKTDEGIEENIAEEYSGCGHDVFCISAKTGAGCNKVRDEIRGRTVCLAGQSAVGKSSMINMLLGEQAMETGTLSRKTDRGRHTTRHSEIFFVDELCATVIDTPGFSVLKSINVEPNELASYYSEFLAVKCKFRGGCLHRNEPGCGVIAGVESGAIPKGRYERYLRLLDELIERKDKHYD